MPHPYKTGGGLLRKSQRYARKAQFRDNLKAYCLSRGIDPHLFMVDLIADCEEVALGVVEGHLVMGPRIPWDLKLKAAKELAQYLEPKLRAMDMEISGNAEEPLVIRIRRGH